MGAEYTRRVKQLKATTSSETIYFYSDDYVVATFESEEDEMKVNQMHFLDYVGMAIHPTLEKSLPDYLEMRKEEDC